MSALDLDSYATTPSSLASGWWRSIRNKSMNKISLTTAIVLAVLSAPAFAASKMPRHLPANGHPVKASAQMNALDRMPVASNNAYRYHGGPKVND
jgi:hypothetical protein